MPAVAPRKTGVVLRWWLGIASWAASRHGFRLSPANDGLSAYDEIGRCSDATTKHFLKI